MSTSWRAYCPVCKKGYVSTTGRTPVTLEDNHLFIWEHAAGDCKADVQLLREYNGRYWNFCEMGYEHPMAIEKELG